MYLQIYRHTSIYYRVPHTDMQISRHFMWPPESSLSGGEIIATVFTSPQPTKFTDIGLQDHVKSSITYNDVLAQLTGSTFSGGRQPSALSYTLHVSNLETDLMRNRPVCPLQPLINFNKFERHRGTVINMDRDTKTKSTQATLCLWRPLRRLVPSEWARSINGFWAHSSFKRRAAKPQTVAVETED